MCGNTHECTAKIFMNNILALTGGKRAKGRGGSGRGVRGVDYGLGIGYSAESSNASTTTTTTVPSRSAAVNSLRTGMMAQFKSNFVAASSNPQNQGLSNSTGMNPNKKMALPGFVSGGTIGGDINSSRASSTSNAATSVQKSREDASHLSSGRSVLLTLCLDCVIISSLLTFFTRILHYHHHHNCYD